MSKEGPVGMNIVTNDAFVLSISFRWSFNLENGIPMDTSVDMVQPG